MAADPARRRTEQLQDGALGGGPSPPRPQPCRAPSRIRQDRPLAGGRARAKTAAPARPPSTRPAVASDPARPVERRAHGDHGHARPPRRSPSARPPARRDRRRSPRRLGQRAIRDDREHDGADEVGAAVGRGQRRRPLAVRGQRRADRHGHQAAHGDQGVGQRRAADVALGVAHPGQQDRTGRSRSSPGAKAPTAWASGPMAPSARFTERRQRGPAARPAPAGRRWPARNRPPSSPPPSPDQPGQTVGGAGEHGAWPWPGSAPWRRERR